MGNEVKINSDGSVTAILKGIKIHEEVEDFLKYHEYGCLNSTIKIVDGNFEEIEARHLFFMGETVETTARKIPDEDDKTQKLLTSEEK